MIRNRSLQLIDATPFIDNLWEFKMLKELMKMMGVKYRVDRVRLGWKPLILDLFNKPTSRFVHFSGHGESHGLFAGELQTVLTHDDFHDTGSNGPGLAGRIFTASACLIGRDKHIAESLHHALGFDRFIAPTIEIPFDDSAMFYLNFYYYIFNRLRERDSRSTRLDIIDGAFENARTSVGLKKEFRLYKFN